MQKRHWPFYTSLITFCCCCVYCGAPSPFGSLCFDRLSTCLVPDSFLQCKPFLEKSPKSVQGSRQKMGNHLMTKCKNVLGFVTCHFLSEYTIEEVSEVMMVGQHK
jgi:hypothetical protein